MVQIAKERISRTFIPKILAFSCSWCSYAGIDSAGISHLQYPASVRVVKTNCIGRLRPDLILEAFYRGADGVLVVGCHVGDCHYISGNEKAEQRLEHMGKLLEGLGIDANRFKIEHIFAYEGKKFSDVVRDFTGQVANLGPNPLKARGA